MAKDYKPCLKPFPSQIVTVVLSNIKKFKKRFCGPDKNVALHHLQCMKPDNKETWMKVGNLATSMATYVASFENLDEAIPGLCCGARHLVSKAGLMLEDVCSKVGLNGSGIWMSDVVNNLLTDALDIMCSGFPSVKVCSEKVPELMTKIGDAMNDDTQFNTTMIVPMVRLITKLDGDINL